MNKYCIVFLKGNIFRIDIVKRGRMRYSASLYPVIVFLAAIIFFGSDIASAPIDEYGDVLENIPEFKSIPGEEYVTTGVEYNKDRSYFNINREDFTPVLDLTGGLYHGRSFFKNVTIQPDGTSVFSFAVIPI